MTEVGHTVQIPEALLADISASGSISFEQFMSQALYHPDYGYYTADAMSIGRRGDFITAPEMSPVFAQTLAQVIARTTQDHPDAVVLELGAGSGAMAADILAELNRLQALPAAYHIVEVSETLRAKQEARLTQQVPHLLERVHWHRALPAQTWSVGVVVANEFFDALPIAQYVHMGDGQFAVRHVGAAAGQLVWVDEPTLASEAQARLAEITAAHGPFSDGYILEVNWQQDAWMRDLAGVFSAGQMIFVDYGDEAAGCYAPDRADGTCRCFYQHHVHGNPLVHVGEQDITADVNFTQLAQVAIDHDWAVASYQSQASFLMASGLSAVYTRQVSAADAGDTVDLSQAIKQLTLPQHMGERFKVLHLSRG